MNSLLRLHQIGKLEEGSKRVETTPAQVTKMVKPSKNKVKLMKSAVLAQPQAILATASHTPLAFACLCSSIGIMPAPRRHRSTSADARYTTKKAPPPPPPPPKPEPRETSGRTRPGVTPGSGRPAGSSSNAAYDIPSKARVAAHPPVPRPKRPCPKNPDAKPEQPAVPMFPVDIDTSDGEDGGSSGHESYTWTYSSESEAENAKKVLAQRAEKLRTKLLESDWKTTKAKGDLWRDTGARGGLGELSRCWWQERPCSVLSRSDNGRV